MSGIQLRSLLLAALSAFTLTLAAQQREADSFKDRLWWGGGFALGFSAFNGTTNIQLGLSPMVGYKITENFSVGPRVSVLATYFSARLLNGNRESTITPTWSAGVFSRYKLFRSIFAHAEYEFENEAYVTADVDDLFVNRRNVNNVYIGAGYNMGGGEILVLYNLNERQTGFGNGNASPFTIRFGFTKNF